MWGGLGATHYQWRPDVLRVVKKIQSRWPGVRVNTYHNHPWPGWDGRSIDVWGVGGRGHAIPLQTGYAIRDYLMELPGTPYIRHTIYGHALWTSWGGYSHWGPDDHSHDLRHLHVTYW